MGQAGDRRYKKAFAKRPYPRKKAYLEFERLCEDRVRIIDSFSETEWELGSYEADFVMALDGRRSPYRIYPWASAQNVDAFLI